MHLDGFNFIRPGLRRVVPGGSVFGPSFPTEIRAYTDAPGFADWTYHHMFLMVPGIAAVTKFLETFKDFPPRQEVGSFNVDAIMERMKEGTAVTTV